jgi:hypothetical protein
LGQGNEKKKTKKRRIQVFSKPKKKKQNRSLLLTYSLKLHPKIETKPQVGESKRFSTTRFGD